MKILRLLVLSVAILMTTVGASHGAPASITPAASRRPGATYPINGALVTAYTPAITFIWTTSAGTGGKYDIDIATDAAFSSIIGGTFGVRISSNSFHLVYAFTPTTYYYWRVQAYASGIPSGWSTFSFRTSVAKPTLIAPLGGTLNNNLPTFSWSSVLGASGYTLQISHTNLFNSSVISVNLPYTSTSYTPATDLPANMILYWHVETLSGTFGPSAWSSIGSFTTANPPGIPTLLLPLTGKVDNDFTPGLFWQAVAVPGGTTFSDYRVQMSTDKTFKNSLALCFNDTSVTSLNPIPPATNVELDVQNALLGAIPGADCPTYTDPTSLILGLQPATTYYWRVRAEGTDGINNFWSNWSTINTLLMSYPQVDSGTFHPDGLLPLTTNLQPFSWHRPTIGTLTNVFALQIFSSPDFQRGGVVNITKNGAGYIPVTPLPACTTLYWRVSEGSYNSTYGSGPWSNSVTIHTACPPSVPEPISPRPGATVSTNKPTLTWKTSVPPFGYPFAYYEIEITPDQSFVHLPLWGDITSITPVSTSSFTLITALSAHGTYYWRMRACDSQPSCSAWSTAFYFKY
jgi:hypothetical protein